MENEIMNQEVIETEDFKVEKIRESSPNEDLDALMKVLPFFKSWLLRWL